MASHKALVSGESRNLVDAVCFQINSLSATLAEMEHCIQPLHSCLKVRFDMGFLVIAPLNLVCIVLACTQHVRLQ